MKQFLADLRDGFEPFWVCGLALLVLDLCRSFSGHHGESSEWPQYLLLGTLFPASVLALAFARPLGRLGQALSLAIRLTLAAYALVTGLSFTAKYATPAILGFATAHWVALRVLTVASGWGCAHRDGDSGTGPADSVATYVVLVLAWVVSGRLAFEKSFEAWATGSTWAALTFAASLGLVTAFVGRGSGAWVVARGRGVSPADLAALVVLTQAGFRLDSLGGPDRFPDSVGLGGIVFYHWGPIVGPAELVRQGGWPLWDVPCQYGLLNTLIVAWLPVGSVWQSFYLINALLTGASGLILYTILRAARPGRYYPWFCLAVSAAAVYLVPGDLRLSSGPSVLPSGGAYRFFWCHALLGILFLGQRAGLDAPPRRRTLLCGCAAWLLGTLWSCESATYCAAVWLPAYVRMVVRRASSCPPGVPRVRAAAWLALPPVLLGATAASVWAFYALALGHGPDWRAFVDYSFANIRNYGTPIDPGGAVWGPFLILCVLSSVVARLIARGGHGAGAVALASGAWGAVWASCSYFVVRSDPGLILNSSPVLCASLASALYLVARIESRGGLCLATTRAACMPVPVVLLTLAYGNPCHLPDWGGSLKRGYIQFVDRRLPVMGPELASLMDRAGVRAQDPVCYLDDSLLLNAMPVRPGLGAVGWLQRAWLPTLPFSLFAPLSGDRGQVYLARFTERTRLGGWLVEPRMPTPPAPLLWFYEGIARTHSPTESYESPHWKVTRYRLESTSPTSPGATSAGERTGRLRGTGVAHEVEVVREVCYAEGEEADREKHRLDLYLPRGERGFPVLMFVHGGAWATGSKDQFAFLGRALAREGLGVVVPNYRLYPEVMFPAAFADVAQAFSWVRENIGRYCGRADRVFLGGHSAGGHLVSLLAASSVAATSAPTRRADVRGVVSISGLYQIERGRFPVFVDTEDAAREASPIRRLGGSPPPFLLIYAEHDFPDLGPMAENFAKAIRQAGGDVICLEARDRDHGSVVTKVADRGDPVRQSILAFVAKCLREEGGSWAR